MNSISRLIAVQDRELCNTVTHVRKKYMKNIYVAKMF